jgi:pimeloyl-ACP methyl ester carboxylesterase
VWDHQLPPQAKETLIRNAPTFLDELQDQTQGRIDEKSLLTLTMPVRLTQGSESPPMYVPVIDRLESLIPHATRETIEGAGHVPHQTTPGPYIDSTKRAIQSAAASRD